MHGRGVIRRRTEGGQRLEMREEGAPGQGAAGRVGPEERPGAKPALGRGAPVRSAAGGAARGSSAPAAMDDREAAGEVGGGGGGDSWSTPRPLRSRHRGVGQELKQADLRIGAGEGHPAPTKGPSEPVDGPVGGLRSWSEGEGTTPWRAGPGRAVPRRRASRGEPCRELRRGEPRREEPR